MLKKAILLTRPESAKIASSPMDAPFRKQGRSVRPKIVLPSSLVPLSGDGG